MTDTNLISTLTLIQTGLKHMKSSLISINKVPT
jgi:hypothetical protein